MTMFANTYTGCPTRTGKQSFKGRMPTFSKVLALKTAGRGTRDITSEVAGVVDASGVVDGLCNVFIMHTSASLILCENADPDVQRDLEVFMSDLVPDGDARFAHSAEGPDDMPAHVRTILTEVSINIPIRGSALLLGTWQGLFLWEHRSRGHTRQVVVTVMS